MPVNPIGAVTNVSSLAQPTAAQLTAAQGPGASSAAATAAQTAPTADAAQAWQEAMRAAMGDASSLGDSSSDPLASLSAQSPAATAATASAPGAAQTALSPQALAALVSGSSSATTSPLITSLSAPTGA
jgi:hypothetical protein